MNEYKSTTVGFTCGAFDLLHAGHVLMLTEAKNQCDWLIVGLHTDPTIDRPQKNKPVQSILERYIQLKALSVVDEVIPYDTEKDLLVILSNYNINVRIIGEDYIGKDFTGKDLPIPIYFNKRKHDYSTTDLRKRVHTKNTTSTDQGSFNFFPLEVTEKKNESLKTSPTYYEDKLSWDLNSKR